MAYLTRIYPMGVGLVVLLLLIAILCQQMLGKPDSPVLSDADQGGGPQASKFVYLGWFLLFMIMIWPAGFTIPSLLFVVTFTTVECGKPIWRNVLLGCGTVATLVILTYVLNTEYPAGLLADVLPFPWWLR